MRGVRVAQPPEHGPLVAKFADDEAARDVDAADQMGAMLCDAAASIRFAHRGGEGARPSRRGAPGDGAARLCEGAHRGARDRGVAEDDDVRDVTCADGLERFAFAAELVPAAGLSERHVVLEQVQRPTGVVADDQPGRALARSQVGIVLVWEAQADEDAMWALGVVPERRWRLAGGRVRSDLDDGARNTRFDVRGQGDVDPTPRGVEPHLRLLDAVAVRSQQCNLCEELLLLGQPQRLVLAPRRPRLYSIGTAR